LLAECVPFVLQLPQGLDQLCVVQLKRLALWEGAGGGAGGARRGGSGERRRGRHILAKGVACRAVLCAWLWCRRGG
jgi:hypothetical protein